MGVVMDDGGQFIMGVGVCAGYRPLSAHCSCLFISTATSQMSRAVVLGVVKSVSFGVNELGFESSCRLF